METNIQKIKSLIMDYETELAKLEEMVDSWNNWQEPSSDPGLQFEQEGIVERKYNAVILFVKSLGVTA